MKIALVCPASLPATQFGGILFLAVDIAREATNLGNDAVIYTTDLDFANNANTFNKDLPKEETLDGFTIKRSHVWFRINLFFVNPGIYFQMMKDSPDVIHTIGIRSFQSFIAAIIAKKKKIPLVISDQGGLTTHPDLKESSFGKKVLIRLQQPLIKLIVNQSSSVIVPNEYEKKIFLNFCDESKISIVKNGIDVDEMRSWDSNFVKKFTNNEEFILFLGRFHEVKGIDTLLEAVNLIKKKLALEKIKILIMGVDFGYEERMEKIIRKFDLFDNICIIKKPTRKDVISAYNTCKFLVLPSKWELSPLTPLEGFACKKTLISTTAHGIPYTISHNENCILVPPSDPLNLSKAILELIRNPQKCKQLGESGFRMVINEGNLETMSTNIFSVYEKTIKLNKGN